MWTSHHTVNLDFFVDACKVLFTDIGNLDDLAGVNLLCGVDCRPHCLLLRPANILQKVCCELGFTDFAVLALT